jgi:hypothetical protein
MATYYESLFHDESSNTFCDVLHPSRAKCHPSIQTLKLARMGRKDMHSPIDFFVAALPTCPAPRAHAARRDTTD